MIRYSPQVREQLEQHSLALDLWTQLREAKNCDITITTSDGTLIPAHQQILMCRSPVLCNMITGPPGQRSLKLDITTPLLTSLLQYIYTDRVDPLDSPQNLLKYAQQLQMPGLKVTGGNGHKRFLKMCQC